MVRQILLPQSRITWQAIISLCLASLTFCLTQETLGQPELDDELNDGANQRRFNLPTITLGGKQLWTDHVHFRDYRIQQNVLTKHFRLIDRRNVRQAWGSFEQCQSRLDEIKLKNGLSPISGKVLILLHGLGRSRGSMNELARYLKEQLGYEIVNVSYASTRASLEDHARALESIIANMPEATQIDVVAHSLGNLVLRRYLYDVAEAHDGAQADARLHRIVMLGPPNNGAEFAKKLNKMRIFGVVMGASATQMADLKGADFSLELAIPQAGFGIIAGNGSLGPLTNPLLDGENDFFVTVEETRLLGAADFIVLLAALGFLLTAPEVHRATAYFLANGLFASVDDRHPIAADSMPIIPEKKKDRN